MRIRPSWRFSLRALLIVMLLLGVLLGMATRCHSRGQRQRQILETAAEAGGHVRYDFECYSESRYYTAHRWLAPRIGPDLVGNVLILNFSTSPPDRWRSALQDATELQSIHYFSACAEDLQPEDVQLLGRFRQLKELHLHYAGDLPNVRPLAELPQLELLGLHSCRGVTMAKLRALRASPRLKKLDLACTDASDEILPLLAEFPALEELHVEASDVTAKGLLLLKSSKSLRIIHLNSEQAGEGIAKRLPQFSWEVK